jgi:hypothetical protein
MAVDRSFVEQNRLATERMRDLAGRLSDKDLQHPVGEHWTVALVFAHLAFLDRRARYVLDATEQENKVVIPDWDLFVNDLVTPLFAAIPPRRATEIAIETAESIDRRLEEYPANLLEMVYIARRRYVVRADHRNEHLNDAEAALTTGKA